MRTRTRQDGHDRGHPGGAEGRHGNRGHEGAWPGGTSRVQRGDRAVRRRSADAGQADSARQGAPLAAIKWVLRNESVDTAIVCMTDHEQLDENMRAMARAVHG